MDWYYTNNEKRDAKLTLYAHQIQIVEGLDLSCIEPGLYDGIGLPLIIDGVDRAPVRSVIWENKTQYKNLYEIAFPSIYV